MKEYPTLTTRVCFFSLYVYKYGVYLRKHFVFLFKKKNYTTNYVINGPESSSVTSIIN